MRSNRVVFSATIGIISSLIIGACTSSPAAGIAEENENPVIAAEDPVRIAEDNPWAAEFVSMHDSAQSDFVRNILADGEITEAEFAEARSRVERCIADAGFTARFEQTEWGTWTLAIPNDQFPGYDDDADYACQEQWMGGIWQLYDLIQSNPDNEDTNDLVAQCLVSQELVPAGFTGRDWIEFLSQSEEMVCTTDPDNPKNKICTGGETLEFLPGGARADSPEAVRCQINPITGIKN